MRLKNTVRSVTAVAGGGFDLEVAVEVVGGGVDTYTVRAAKVVIAAPSSYRIH
jgi:hypothetical protein